MKKYLSRKIYHFIIWYLRKHSTVEEKENSCVYSWNWTKQFEMIVRN